MRNLLMLALVAILGMGAVSCDPTSAFDEVKLENGESGEASTHDKDKEEGTPPGGQ